MPEPAEKPSLQSGSGRDFLQDSSTSSLCCRQRTSGCICWCVWYHCPDRACGWRLLKPLLQPSGHLFFCKSIFFGGTPIVWLTHPRILRYQTSHSLQGVSCSSPVMFICIPNRLTVSGSGEGPAKLIAKSCNGSHTILDICCPNFLVRISLRAKAVSSSFPVIATSMQ